MPSPLLQLRIPQDLADWLEAKHPSRGEVAEYVRQLLTAEQMKEAVAPLVPDFNVAERMSVGNVARITNDADGNLKEVEIWTQRKAEPKPKARRKKSYEVAPTPEFSITTNSVQTPARCNRGACTGTINPVSGRCLHCMQKPLKESK